MKNKNEKAFIVDGHDSDAKAKPEITKRENKPSLKLEPANADIPGAFSLKLLTQLGLTHIDRQRLLLGAVQRSTALLRDIQHRSSLDRLIDEINANSTATVNRMPSSSLVHFARDHLVFNTAHAQRQNRIFKELRMHIADNETHIAGNETLPKTNERKEPLQEEDSHSIPANEESLFVHGATFSRFVSGKENMPLSPKYPSVSEAQTIAEQTRTKTDRLEQELAEMKQLLETITQRGDLLQPQSRRSPEAPRVPVAVNKNSINVGSAELSMSAEEGSIFGLKESHHKSNAAGIPTNDKNGAVLAQKTASSQIDDPLGGVRESASSQKIHNGDLVEDVISSLPVMFGAPRIAMLREPQVHAALLALWGAVDVNRDGSLTWDEFLPYFTKVVMVMASQGQGLSVYSSEELKRIVEEQWEILLGNTRRGSGKDEELSSDFRQSIPVRDAIVAFFEMLGSVSGGQGEYSFRAVVIKVLSAFGAELDLGKPLPSGQKRTARNATTTTTEASDNALSQGSIEKPSLGAAAALLNAMISTLPGLSDDKTAVLRESIVQEGFWALWEAIDIDKDGTLSKSEFVPLYKEVLSYLALMRNTRLGVKDGLSKSDFSIMMDGYWETMLAAAAESESTGRGVPRNIVLTSLLNSLVDISDESGVSFRALILGLFQEIGPHLNVNSGINKATFVKSHVKANEVNSNVIAVDARDLDQTASKTILRGGRRVGARKILQLRGARPYSELTASVVRNEALYNLSPAQREGAVSGLHSNPGATVTQQRRPTRRRRHKSSSHRDNAWSKTFSEEALGGSDGPEALSRWWPIVEAELRSATEKAWTLLSLGDRLALTGLKAASASPSLGHGGALVVSALQNAPAVRAYLSLIKLLELRNNVVCMPTSLAEQNVFSVGALPTRTVDALLHAEMPDPFSFVLLPLEASFPAMLPSVETPLGSVETTGATVSAFARHWWGAGVFPPLVSEDALWEPQATLVIDNKLLIPRAVAFKRGVWHAVFLIVVSRQVGVGWNGAGTRGLRAPIRAPSGSG